MRPDGVADGDHVFTFATNGYQEISRDSGRFILWLKDGRRLLHSTTRGALCLVEAGGGSRVLLPPGSLAGDVASFGISADDRLLVYLRTRREADVWMISPRGPQ